MIDVENYVVDAIVKGLASDYPDAKVYSTRLSVPAKFPAVMIYEVNNTEVSNLSCIDRVERFSDVNYTLEIYTNDTHKKQSAKELFAACDEILRNMVKTQDGKSSSGFTRTGKSYVMSYNESELFGIVGFYVAMVGEHPDGSSITFYRR